MPRPVAFSSNEGINLSKKRMGPPSFRNSCQAICLLFWLGLTSPGIIDLLSILKSLKLLTQLIVKLSTDGLH